jgi:hypothetical protein
MLLKKITRIFYLEKTALMASFFYEEIICRHGCPRELLTDQGMHFVNEMIDSMCNQLGVKHRLSTPYQI